MADTQKIIDGLETAKYVINKWIPMFEQYNTPSVIDDAIRELMEKRPKEECTAKWIDDHCSYCKCDIPAFISGSSWEQYPTEYCPTCGARMTNGR